MFCNTPLLLLESEIHWLPAPKEKQGGCYDALLGARGRRAAFSNNQPVLFLPKSTPIKTIKKSLGQVHWLKG